jgi:hypothetical protein
MMGERQGRQERLFYEFCLEDRIPADYLLRSQPRSRTLSILRHPTLRLTESRPATTCEIMAL